MKTSINLLIRKLNKLTRFNYYIYTKVVLGVRIIELRKSCADIDLPVLSTQNPSEIVLRLASLIDFFED